MYRHCWVGTSFWLIDPLRPTDLDIPVLQGQEKIHNWKYTEYCKAKRQSLFIYTAFLYLACTENYLVKITQGKISLSLSNLSINMD